MRAERDTESAQGPEGARGGPGAQGGSGGAGVQLDLAGTEEGPQAGDLQRPDDGSGRRDDLQADALRHRPAVRGGEDAETSGVQEGHLDEVDDDLAGLGLEDGLETLAEHGGGGGVDLADGGQADAGLEGSDVDGHQVAGGGIHRGSGHGVPFNRLAGPVESARRGVETTGNRPLATAGC